MMSRSILAMLAIAVVAANANQLRAETPSIVMKLSSPTVNDASHEWMKRFAAIIERTSGDRIKTELYPAGQLGSIPRLIEGTQLGAIQATLIPPEFLVGVDQRFELLAAPGLFQNDAQVIKTITDPDFTKAFFAIGTDKGLIGAGILFNGPAAFVMRTPIRTLADFRGRKIRVLASTFQTEQIAKLGGTGVPMSFGDVLPALQQGVIDGALGTVPVFTALHYQETARFITETGQSYIQTMILLSKKWFDGLPADLQVTVQAAATQADKEVIPWARDFLAQQRKMWIEKGGELIALPPTDEAELMTRTGMIADDIVKAKPQLRPMWELLVAAARRSE